MKIVDQMDLDQQENKIIKQVKSLLLGDKTSTVMYNDRFEIIMSGICPHCGFIHNDTVFIEDHGTYSLVCPKTGGKVYVIYA